MEERSEYTERLEFENALLKRENEVFRAMHAGESVVLDFWKEGDIGYVVTTDGIELRRYSKMFSCNEYDASEELSRLKAENEQLKSQLDHWRRRASEEGVSVDDMSDDVPKQFGK